MKTAFAVVLIALAAAVAAAIPASAGQPASAALDGYRYCDSAGGWVAATPVRCGAFGGATLTA